MIEWSYPHGAPTDYELWTLRLVVASAWLTLVAEVVLFFLEHRSDPEDRRRK